MRRIDYWKMSLLWAITQFVNKRCVEKLYLTKIGYGNDEFGFPIIEIENQLTETNNRLGIIQPTDKFIWGIKTIWYCFNLRPYKL